MFTLFNHISKRKWRHPYLKKKEIGHILIYARSERLMKIDRAVLENSFAQKRVRKKKNIVRKKENENNLFRWKIFTRHNLVANNEEVFQPII